MRSVRLFLSTVPSQFATRAMKTALGRFLLPLVLISSVFFVPEARAQLQPGRSYWQVGLAAIPGVGAQAAYIQTRALYTIEGSLYIDYAPRFAGGEGSVQLSGSVGGAIRAFGIVRAIGDPSQSNSDLDVGFRLGPSLIFAQSESTRSENPFSLFLEPYGRFSTNLSTDRTAFIEIGLQRPIVRVGLIFEL